MCGTKEIPRGIFATVIAASHSEHFLDFCPDDFERISMILKRPLRSYASRLFAYTCKPQAQYRFSSKADYWTELSWDLHIRDPFCPIVLVSSISIPQLLLQLVLNRYSSVSSAPRWKKITSAGGNFTTFGYASSIGNSMVLRTIWK